MPITAGRIGATAIGTGTTGKNQKSPELASGPIIEFAMEFWILWFKPILGAIYGGPIDRRDYRGKS
jgi:hypothetical protein